MDINISMFDYMCQEQNIDKRFLQFLPKQYLRLILLKLTPKMSLKKITEEMNKTKFYGSGWTQSVIKHKLHLAMAKLFEIKLYAEMFNVVNNINVPTYEELVKLSFNEKSDVNDNV